MTSDHNDGPFSWSWSYQSFDSFAGSDNTLHSGAGACEEGCVSTFDKCGGGGIERALACCDPHSQCVTNQGQFAQCRPKSDDSQRWLSATVLACGMLPPTNLPAASQDWMCGPAHHHTAFTEHHLRIYTASLQLTSALCSHTYAHSNEMKLSSST